MFNRVLMIVLDSVGVGAAPDAAKFGDEGCNTLLHILKTTDIELPNLVRMGLGNLFSSDVIPSCNLPIGAYGTTVPEALGKDTTTGHWEMMGVVLDRPLPVYPNGFPREIICKFTAAIGRNILGNVVASGTEIIARLGQEHVDTGYPIVYTSADSVFQIAAHEDVVPVDMLYNFCVSAREILTGEHAVGRVIARPFIGEFPNYTRTSRRRDFALIPPGETALDILTANDIGVYAVGKIEDIFAGRGITESKHSKNNDHGIECIMEYLNSVKKGFIFANLVDFDMVYGHRRDPYGYGRALECFDSMLPKILSNMTPEDCLIISADHGNDPTFRGTDHTREKAPLLVHSSKIKPMPLGERKFKDIGATIVDCYGLSSQVGTSFLSAITKRS